MKLDQLRKIIREEVRAAVKEELQEVMNEAVKVASTPTGLQPAPIAGETSWSAPKKPSKQDLAEMMGLPDLKPKTTNLKFDDPIQEMLNQTKSNMSGEEYKNVMNFDSSMVQKPNFASSMANQMGMTSPENMPGLDISQLSFVKKAKKVYDLANEKSSNKL
jgi:hypothetical protein